MATLYLVATPIGNLGDITLRAVKVLDNSEVLYCEDTRVTHKLLSHLNIKTAGKKIASLNLTNEYAKVGEVIDDLNAGKQVCIVSDAGMPLISDPGVWVVSKVLEADHIVTVVPGPSSVTAALAMCGFNSDRFYFAGFIPKGNSEKAKALEFISRMNCTSVFFESPHRLVQTVEELVKTLSPDRKIGIAKELTKLNETLLVKPASEILLHLEKLTIKGEFVVLVAPNTTESKNSDTDAISLYEELVSSGVDTKTAIVFVSKYLKISKNHLYSLLKISS